MSGEWNNDIMLELKKLTKRITSQLKATHTARIPDEHIADAVRASPDDKYQEDVQKAVDQLCQENNGV